MAAPFYNAIKSGTTGAPGTGAFTHNATVIAGYKRWSDVLEGWIGLVRFDDGADWEIVYCYKSATTLSRSANQYVNGSTGSLMTLTSAATATMVADANEIAPHPAVPQRSYKPITNAATMQADGFPAAVLTGTAAAAALATTNLLTERPRLQLTSATTASAQAGVSNTSAFLVHSTAAGKGGFEFVAQFGASQIPTGPRVFCGVTGTTFVGSAVDPSTVTAHYAGLAKDVADTNLQFLTNSNVSTGTKIDTGIALVANGWYEVSIWAFPGEAKIYFLLVRMDTGAIFYTSTTSDVPASGAMFAQCLAGLGTSTGTAMILHQGGIFVRNGG